MARAPFQVLVYPYCRTQEGGYEYAIFRRADEGFWQGIAGGGEDEETPLQAARREAFEEAGIGPDAEWLRLDTVEPIPVTEFRNSAIWGEGVYVIPQYCFGVKVADRRMALSHEHTEYAWLPYEEAVGRLKYDGNKTALWELEARLRGQGPRGGPERRARGA